MIISTQFPFCNLTQHITDKIPTFGLLFYNKVFKYKSKDKIIK